MSTSGKLQLKRRLGLGLAALALALQAFWPLIAQARPRNVNLVPLCTVDGVTHYVEVPGGQTPAEKRTTAHGEHCGLCMVGAAIAAPTPELAPLADAAFAVPFSQPSFFAAVPAVLPGRPRAPPAAS